MWIVHSFPKPGKQPGGRYRIKTQPAIENYKLHKAEIILCYQWVESDLHWQESLYMK